jgi:hypothetical protein
MSELDKIDLHLGSHSANPPYTIPELLGAPVSDRIKAELWQYGVDEFHPSGGFSCRTASALRSALRLKTKLL